MKKRIKIMYLLPSEGFGGAERQGALLMGLLPRQGIDVVPVIGPGRRIEKAMRESGIRRWHFSPHIPGEYARPYGFLAHSRYVAGTLLSWRRAYREMVLLLQKEPVDLILASRPAAWTLAGPLGRRFHIPVIWRAGGRAHGAFRRGGMFLLERFFTPERLIANCRAVVQSLENLVHAPIHVVHNGIDTNRFHPSNAPLLLRRKFNIPQGAAIIGLAARPCPDKGMDILSEVVQKVAAARSTVCFAIAGEFGWRSRIQRAFKDKGLDGNVRFLGHVQDMPGFYMMCDVIILTSRRRSIEGSPNAILEAMAMERPVIAASAGGVPEIITSGVNGILTPAGDGDLFSAHVLGLLENPSRRQALGKAARQTVLARFSAGRAASAMAWQIHSSLNIGSGGDRAPLAEPGFPDRYEKVPAPVRKPAPVTLRIALKTGLAVLAIAALILGLIPVVTHGSAAPYPALVSGSDLHSASPAGRGDWVEKLSLSDFKKVGKLSGRENYYSLQADSSGKRFWHAHYRPGMRTVTLGLKISGKLRNANALTWRWRVQKYPEGADEQVKGKGDSAGAVYCFFKTRWRTYALKYIISVKLAAGTVIRRDRPYTFHKMFVVVIRRARPGGEAQWQTVRADFNRDFKRFFKVNQPPPISGIAFLTDGDNTSSEVITDYADFTLLEQPE